MTRLAHARTAAVLLLAMPAAFAPPAVASISAVVSVQTTSGTRIVVGLTSSRRLTARQRPTAVSVKAGRATFKLSRVRGASAAVVSLGTWRTRLLTGAAAGRAMALRGQPVTVVLSSSRGTIRLSATVAKPTGPGGPGSPSGGPPSGTPLFNPPGQELTGQAAFDSFKRYFLGSEFSDCQVGHWPACAVENRYEHGADGTFEYRRCTPTSGADINFVDTYTIAGAAQHADGSWIVEYTDQNGAGFYHWEVSVTGTVNGYYIYNGGSPEYLSGYFWRQPADLGDCYS